MNPIVSIVIANYNYGRFLGDAIASVVNQGLQDAVELIVCDGGSSDNSVEVIKKYAKGISWWCSEPDKGQSDAFNKGFSHAKGRFLTWLNADDVFVPGSLRMVVDYIMSHPSCNWLVGSSFWANERLEVKRCFCSHRFSRIRAKACMLSANGPSSFFSRELYERAGGYVDTRLNFCMDTDLWYRFYMKCGVRYDRILRPVFVYRIHGDSKMSGADVSATEKAFKNRRRAHEEWRQIMVRNGLDESANRFWPKVLSYSFADLFIRLYYTVRYRGRLANEL